jgi:hypothetical protein
MTDFEQALINAFSHSLPLTQHRGCYFHFRQANHRHISSSNSDSREKSTEDVLSTQLKCLIDFAFVPPANVAKTFETLDSTPFFRENREFLDQYWNYFQNTWIGGFDRRGNRKNPKFAIDLWNCYDSVLADLPKPNNFCEGFHSGFTSLLSFEHPSISKFVEGLLEQLSLTTF